MALVAYSDESDMSDGEANERSAPTIETENKTISNGIESIVDEEDIEPCASDEVFSKSEDTFLSNIFKFIPSVKTMVTKELKENKVVEDDVVDDVPTLKTWKIQKTTIGNISFDVKKEKGSKKVKITLPSLLEFEEEEECEPEPVKKKFKPSGSGTGLFSVLPSPKVTEKRVNSFIPESLKKKLKKSIGPPKPVPKTTAVDSDEEEASVETGNFFSFNDDDFVKPIVPPISAKPSLTVDSTPIIEEPTGVNLSIEETAPLENSVDFGPAPNPTKKLDETALLRLTGKRNTKEVIDIIDIHADDALLDREEWEAKALSEEKPSQSFAQKKEGMPSATQKKKHQITYLAHQAKAREQDLKNMWAQNRLTKRQTQAKYGF